MATSNGSFVWYELMTTDTAAAEHFYRDVVGWRMQDAGMSGMRYTILHAGETSVGGLMALPAEASAAGARTGWIGYIAVDDVDAYAKRVTQAGGGIHRAPDDIPGVGRFAVVADPQGAAFVLFKGADGQQPERPAMGTPGHAGWRELMSSDWQSAFAFYASLFGWTKAEAIDMGPMGTYQLFATGAEPVGGMMTKPETVPAPFWQYYFNVDNIDPAAGRVKNSGGQVINGPMEVPGGMWIIHCLDPQGGVFALVGPRSQAGG